MPGAERKCILDLIEHVQLLTAGGDEDYKLAYRFRASGCFECPTVTAVELAAQLRECGASQRSIQLADDVAAVVAAVVPTKSAARVEVKVVGESPLPTGTTGWVHCWPPARLPSKPGFLKTDFENPLTACVWHYTPHCKAVIGPDDWPFFAGFFERCATKSESRAW